MTELYIHTLNPFKTAESENLSISSRTVSLLNIIHNYDIVQSGLTCQCDRCCPILYSSFWLENGKAICLPVSRALTNSLVNLICILRFQQNQLYRNVAIYIKHSSELLQILLWTWSLDNYMFVCVSSSDISFPGTHFLANV